MIDFRPVTLSEAQYLLRRPQQEINRAIDRGEVDKITEVVVLPPASKTAKRSRGPRKTIRKLGTRELLFFALERDIRDDLTPAGRRKLYNALKTRAPDARVIRIGPLQVDIAGVAMQLETRFKELKLLGSAIVEQTASDPLLKDTNISVYRIAALAEEQSIAEILADYPGLREKEIVGAIEYARAYPKRGRPYPSRSFKRAAGALADAGIFDLPDQESAED